MSVWNHIEQAIKSRVLILDGAMGTSLQKFKLEEAEYRGAQFKDWPSLLKGNNDILSVTQPDKVRAVHADFLAAGADMIETNTFNATSISQGDYGLSDFAPTLAEEGAKIARSIADEWSAKTPQKPRAVLGAIGPLSKTLSLSPRVEDAGYREVTFDNAVVAYREQITAMFEHVDALLIETVFDTLNCKAAIFAAQSVFEEKEAILPIIISGTITDKSGRTLSGQTTEAFWTSIKHANPFAVGLNCALGAKDMRPYIQTLSRIADTYIIAYPNAGLPNAFGEYDETPEQMAGAVVPWAIEGFTNILGGCCGSTPKHIAAIAETAKGVTPRVPSTIIPALQLSGLEPFALAG